MSHADIIQENYDALLRCTTINYYVIDCLRTEEVLDRTQEAKLKGKRNTLTQRILLFKWLKELPYEKYESFLQVMNETEQEHVTHLLSGKTEEGHLPLLKSRHDRIEKNRPKIAHVIFADSELIAELLKSKAISKMDAEEIRAEKVEYVKSSKLISAIMRRSNECYNSFQEGLRKTLQAAAAEFLNEGEMPAVHLNSNRPDLDESLSFTFNQTIRNNSENDTRIKELITEMNGYGLTLVKAIPGQSIVIFIYCKTVQSAVKFTQLFNSGILQYILDSILSRLLLRIEPHNKEELNSFIHLEDDEIGALEEFTGIDGWKAQSHKKLKLFGKESGRDATTQTDGDLLKKKVSEDALYQEVRHLGLRHQPTKTKEMSGKAEFSLAFEKARIEEEILEETTMGQQQGDFLAAEIYRAVRKQHRQREIQLLTDLEDEGFRKQYRIHQFQRTKQTQLKSVSYEQHSNLIHKNYDWLIESLDPDSGLLPLLVRRRVLRSGEYQSIRSSNNRLKKNSILLSILLWKTTDDYREFQNALIETRQSEIAYKIAFDFFQNASSRMFGRDGMLRPRDKYSFPSAYEAVLPVRQSRNPKFVHPSGEYRRAQNLNELPVKCLKTIILKILALNKGHRKAQHQNLASVCTTWRNIVATMNYKYRRTRLIGDSREDYSSLKWIGLLEETQKENDTSKELLEHQTPAVELPVKFRSDPVLVQTISTKDAEERSKAIRGMAILDKELFVVSETSSEIEVYDSVKFVFSRQWNLRELISPQDMGSCTRNQCLYIVDSKVIGQLKEILRVDSRGMLIKNWSTGDDFGWSLSVTDESNVILAVYNKHKLSEYSPDGQLIREINLLSDAGIHCPRHAMKLTSDHFVVSHGFGSFDPHKVSIVDANGKLQKSFGGTQGSTIAQMNSPVYLFVDENGFVLVVDHGNSRVLLLDPDLEYRKEFLSKEKHDLLFPQRILLDESNCRLFVADNDGKDGRILIFQLK